MIVNNGKQVVSADSGGLLKIWDLSSKECVTTMEAHDEKIWTMIANDDESQFVTGKTDILFYFVQRKYTRRSVVTDMHA